MIKYNSGNDKEALKNYVYRKSNVTRANKLIIITGYTGPETVRWLKDLDYDTIELYVGMYGKSIKKSLHNSLLNVNKEDNINIYYTNSLVHSKIYLWFRDNELMEYAIGSANFSANALIENCYKETLDCFDDISINNNINDYLNIIKNKRIYIDGFETSDVNEDFDLHLEESIKGELTLLSTRADSHENILGISTNKNDVSASSCLNWGYSNGLPQLGDAYIPISSLFLKTNPEIFGEKNKDDNMPIEVIWDDGEVMTLLLEGNNEGIENGKIYPKQISSYKDKSILGDYLRKRIGEKINRKLLFTDDEIKYVKEYKKQIQLLKETGRLNDNFKDILKNNRLLYNSICEKFIDKTMLDEYGSYKIKVEKISEGVYEFSF